MNDAADAIADNAATRRQIEKALRRFRVVDGAGFRLKQHDPADHCGHMLAKADAVAMLETGVELLSALQEKLYAEGRWAVLCVFQAMDAAGKDGTIKHVMSGVNPQGVLVTSFKAPGPEDLAHDFLWRIHRALPQRGQIGIFNRSHYEEVLVTRVHDSVLDRQRLPDAVRGKHFWRHQLEDIAAFEAYLGRQGILVLKFFLHLSKDEQRRRFMARLDAPEKVWKFSASDLAERGFWEDYQDAYEHAIAATATPHAPWFVMPADDKRFCRLMVVAAMVQALESLDLQFPAVSDEQHAALAAARKVLEAE